MVLINLFGFEIEILISLGLSFPILYSISFFNIELNVVKISLIENP